MSSVRPDFAGLLQSALLSLLLTLLVELAAAFIIGVRSREGLKLAALVNCITNPAAVTVNYTAALAIALLAPGLRCTPQGDGLLWAVLMLTEAAAWMYEYRFYKKRPDLFSKPLLLAFSCNALSYSAGRLLPELIMYMQLSVINN